MPKYRAVKAYDSSDVIAIGYDEGQGGKDYNGIGEWCNFTFDEIPAISQTVMNLVTPKPIPALLKVSGSKVVTKTSAEVTAALEV